MNHVPVLVAPRRTPIGNAGHGFADLTVTDLATPVLREVLTTVRGAGIDAEVDDVILGNCLGPGGDPARIVALHAGAGVHVPGVTVDRQCGSGLDAVMQAALRVRSGADELILAGGVESASTAPWRFWPPIAAADPVRYTRAPFAPPGFPDPDMGAAADDLARVRGISRQRQDAYAARSHTLAAAADFSAEIVPIGDVHRDERIRAGMTEARLARLRPSFGVEGTATAGNSCGISDGAAMLAVTSESLVAGLPALRILRSAVAGSDRRFPVSDRCPPFGNCCGAPVSIPRISVSSRSPRRSPRWCLRCPMNWVWTNPRSVRRAAPSRWAIRGVRPELSCWCGWQVRCCARVAPRSGSRRVPSAAGKASRCSWSECRE